LAIIFVTGGEKVEQSALKEILNALKLHSGHIDKKLSEMENRFDNKLGAMENRFDNKLDAMEEGMNKRFDQIDVRFDRLEKKVDGMRVELTETQENVDYLLSKNAQHEKKLRKV